MDSSVSVRGCQPPKTTSICIYTILFAVSLLNGIRSVAPATAEPPNPALTNEDTILSAGAGSIGSINYVPKRNWKSLQGAWGKRALDAGISAELSDADADDVYFAERRIPLPLNLPAVHGAHPILKYSLVYLRNENAANMLDNLLNGADDGATTSLDDDTSPHASIGNNQLKTERYDDMMDLDSLDAMGNAFFNQKRAWKSMNVGWGKRRNAPQWNKFRGAWGKREPGWNNLKGMWGKRSSKDWQKLHGSWGKRSASASDDTN